MENKKYELTNETKEVDGHILHRIRSLKTFILRDGLKFVHVGDRGGWIENERNLSHCGRCWVDGNSIIMGEARVLGNTYVGQDAMVYDFAVIQGDASILGYSKIHGHANIRGTVITYDNTEVQDYASVRGEAQLYDSCSLHDHAYVDGSVSISKNAILCRQASVCGYKVHIGYNAVLTYINDIITIGPIGSRCSSYTTFYRTGKPGEIYVCCGCFNDSIKEFEKAVIKTHSKTKYKSEYLAAIELAKARLLP